MIKPVNEDEVRKAIQHKCVEIGRANFIKLSKCKHSSFLSNVISGNRTPTEDMLKLIGYKLTYVKVTQWTIYT